MAKFELYILLITAQGIAGAEKNLSINAGFLAPPHVKLWTISTLSSRQLGLPYPLSEWNFFTSSNSETDSERSKAISIALSDTN